MNETHIYLAEFGLISGTNLWVQDMCFGVHMGITEGAARRGENNMPRMLHTKTQEEIDNEEMSAMDYPEIVVYFVTKFDPTKESTYSFFKRHYKSHKEFLMNRGWSEEKIDDLWQGMVQQLDKKRIHVLQLQQQPKYRVIRGGDGRGKIIRVTGTPSNVRRNF